MCIPLTLARLAHYPIVPRTPDSARYGPQAPSPRRAGRKVQPLAVRSHRSGGLTDRRPRSEVDLRGGLVGSARPTPQWSAWDVDIRCVMRDDPCMRTTLDIDDDVLEAAKEIASARRLTAGQVLSELARRGLEPARVESRVRNGVPLLPQRPPGAPRPTMTRVNNLRDDA